MEFLSELTLWHWLILGGALMIVEVVIPSTFFLWPGIAAVITGILKMIIPTLSGIACVGIWAVLSLVCVVAWVMYRKKNPAPKPESTLNQRGTQYLGQTFTLTKPLENGKGEIKAGDTVWLVTGSDTLPAGALVKVSGADGSLLKVEKA
ncbi:MAG: NfeD family protein [Micavibrio sp.]